MSGLADCTITELVIAVGETYWRCTACQLRFSRHTSIDNHLQHKHGSGVALENTEVFSSLTLPGSISPKLDILVQKGLAHTPGLRIGSQYISNVGKDTHLGFECATSQEDARLPLDMTAIVPFNFDFVNYDGDLESADGLHKDNVHNRTVEVESPMLNCADRENIAHMHHDFQDIQVIPASDNNANKDGIALGFPFKCSEINRKEPDTFVSDINDKARDTNESSETEEDSSDEDISETLVKPLLGLLEKSLKSDDVECFVHHWDSLEPEPSVLPSIFNNSDPQSYPNSAIFDKTDSRLNSTDELLDSALASLDAALGIQGEDNAFVDSYSTVSNITKDNTPPSESCQWFDHAQEDVNASSCGNFNSDNRNEVMDARHGISGLLKYYMKSSTPQFQVANVETQWESFKGCTGMNIAIPKSNFEASPQNIASHEPDCDFLNTVPCDLHLNHGGQSDLSYKEKFIATSNIHVCCGNELCLHSSSDNIVSHEGRQVGSLDVTSSATKLCLSHRRDHNNVKGFITSFAPPSLTQSLSCTPEQKNVDRRNTNSCIVGMDNKLCQGTGSEKNDPPNNLIIDSSKQLLNRGTDDGTLNPVNILSLPHMPSEVRRSTRSRKINTRFFKAGENCNSELSKITEQKQLRAPKNITNIKYSFNKLLGTAEQIKPSKISPRNDQASNEGESTLQSLDSLSVHTGRRFEMIPGGKNKSQTELPCEDEYSSMVLSTVSDSERFPIPVQHTRPIPEVELEHSNETEDLQTNCNKTVVKRVKTGNDHASRIEKSGDENMHKTKKISLTNTHMKVGIKHIIKDRPMAKPKVKKMAKPALKGVFDKKKKRNSQTAQADNGNQDLESRVGNDDIHKKTHSAGAPKWKTCNICDRNFSTYGALERHLKVNSLSNDSCKCKVCSKKFHNLFQLNIHIYKCHEIKGKPTCFKCNTQLSNVRGLIQHVQRHKCSLLMHSTNKSKTWKCTICGIHTLNQPSIIAAHNRKHTVTRAYQCTSCDKRFLTRSALNIHTAAHTGRMFQCELCGQFFKNKTSRHYHKLTHDSLRGDFLCQVCGQQFEFHHKLTAHVKIHSKEKRASPSYNCGDCGRVYKSKKCLQRHVDVEHKGIKDYKFKCEHCEQQFFASWQLRDHIAWHHFGEKPYQCQFCGQGFVCKPTMVRHQRTVHTGVRPHKCKFCQESFIEKHQLELHEVKVHTGVYPLSCPHCQKGFVRTSSLKNHVMTHTDERRFQCCLCGKRFQKANHLNRHNKMCVKKNATAASYMYDIGSLPDATLTAQLPQVIKTYLSTPSGPSNIMHLASTLMEHPC